MKKILSLILSFSFAFMVQAQETQNFTHDCFSVLVGKEASFDGSVLFAHNEDDWGDRLVNCYRVPQRTSKKGKTITLKEGAKLSEIQQTWEYLWLEMPEMEFSDTYMNEWGVTIASDACLSKEKDPDLTEGGIGYWLRRAMAERATSAKDAVKIGGELVHTYGYSSSGRTYCIADANEAWMMSVVYGKHWIAQRVPDDQVAIIPNYYTIQTINLEDTLNFLGSPDIIEYAVEKGWYDPKVDSVFNFREVYSDQGNLGNMGNIVRHRSSINLLSEKQYQIDDDFPFSFEPNEKVQLNDLFNVLRNHNEGSEYDKSEDYTKGHPHEFGRAICSNTTQYGFVAQLRADMPKEVAYCLWLSPYRPCVHAFTPWYFGMNKLPEGYFEGSWETALENHFEPIEDVFELAPDNHFLEFVKHARKVDKNYKDEIEGLKAVWQKHEDEMINRQPNFEKRVIKIMEEDREKAMNALTGYTLKQLGDAERVLEN